ncbi:hypothetical protein EPUS_04599 [Endocarpon pusillum Z07020]|uniref:DNA replication regulator Sld3 C-terminal domain-containing protein n=1 Tax=Endocarpon pusillum (strain Z07020 / HMAS-L-300199) TaxID=1263415 RepID=U1I159_ENDPU|nr:uncharacterized protein EPUS_04599 [Endocarpon pusillum Z07020]ERF75619.1 hypothetical protein EPUS_04599 [Endocarpon pusillum Z07020]
MAEAISCPRPALSRLSQSTLNCRDSSSKKRKLVEDVVHDPYLQPFTAIPLPDSGSKSTHTFLPITMVDPSQLRLSYLEFAPELASLPPGRTFHADFPIFNDRTPKRDVKLLVARLAPNGGLYIIENEGSGLFVACRLRSWVTENWFGANVTGDVDKAIRERLCSSDNKSTADDICPKNGLATARVAGIPSPKRPKNKKGVLARMSIMPKMEPGCPSAVKQGQESTLQKEVTADQPPAIETPPADMSSDSSVAARGLKPDVSGALHQPAEMLDAEKGRPVPAPPSFVDDSCSNAHEILLQTLYTSKSTLAYFAKSTLARTRAAFRSSTTASTSELAEFYRGRLITSKKMDLKYRDTIPKIIENAILQVSPTPSAEKQLPKCSKRKLNSRKKLGKDGLYAGEETFIRTWWLNRDGAKNDLTGVNPRDQEMQALLKELRNRETQLQIILILEILTLELRQDVRTGGSVSVTSVKKEPDDDSTGILAKTPLKINEKRDLRSDLDILVDRLCIYQSVSIIDPITADEAKKQNGESGNEVSDQLRDFCCNVILPFYRHKAPDLVKEISRKLGGPNLSPKRPNFSSRTSSGTRTKPGTAIDTYRRSIPRQTLERVLSEEQSSRQSSPPMLMRSATAPMGGGNSGSLDPAETVPRPSSRGSLQKSRTFSNREVDLVASSNAHNAKRKKLANLAKQKEELDAAIHALRKPNRGLVGMEIMTEVERRREERASCRRSNLERRVSDQSLSVQITATPRKGEIVGSMGREVSSLNQTSITQLGDRVNSMPEEPVIPSSTVKPVNNLQNQFLSKTFDTTMTKRHIHLAAYETPSRGSCRTSNPLGLTTSTHLLQQPDLPATTYSGSKPTLVQATPSASRLRADHANLTEVESTPLRMTKSHRPVTMFQSLKKAEVTIEDAFRDAPIVSEKAGKAMDRAMNAGGAGAGKEASIYASLGWDDDVDELL